MLENKMDDFMYTISFKSALSTVVYKIQSKNEQMLDEVVDELLSIFAQPGTRNVQGLQRYHAVLGYRIQAFVDKYEPLLGVTSRRIPAFFRTLVDGEYFCIVPWEMTDQQSVQVHVFLKTQNEPERLQGGLQLSHDLFSGVFRIYKVDAYGHDFIRIGTQSREKRTCRFCGVTNNAGCFKNVAHAIPESLGNKTIILNDECDVCNSMFGRTIEFDIITYFSFYRTLFEVTGKGGKKKVKGMNFEFEAGEMFKLKVDDIVDGKAFLKHSVPVIAQNIYKALCKSFLSVVDEPLLPLFVNTIAWIRGDLVVKRLPKVAMLLRFHDIVVQPKIAALVQRGEDAALPYAVGEFYFTCFTIVFVIPLCSRDTVDFSDPEAYDIFWRFSTHYHVAKGWVFQDFSDPERRIDGIPISFVVTGGSRDA